ncbi:NERD domain-containing protein [Rossellomorea aquimaris]|uniref:nuclease-related domain-containing protein n=1 Tax=Rossellomorea aquimaris TaxID=189382 RepID=UPI001CD5658E|nr:NERD domain-containing protein [Rossellomorea aquimaris]MCA1055278.1 NERD domain-containing protein [Rossellomorea aquimaris]
MGIIIVITMIVGVVLLSTPSVKGKIGEGEVKYYLRKLNNSDKYRIFHDILLPSSSGGTTQIDHIVISQAGIFVIETKNYKGWIFGNEQSMQWTQVIYKRKQKFYNPFYQNHGHIKAIERIIGEQIKVPYYNVVVFGSRAVIKRVSVESPNFHVVSAKHLPYLIANHQQKNISEFHIKGIGLRLENNEVSHRGAGKEHKLNVKKTQELKSGKINNGICPKCGADLVARISTKNGRSFKGCSNFPKCRFIA